MVMLISVTPEVPVLADPTLWAHYWGTAMSSDWTIIEGHGDRTLHKVFYRIFGDLRLPSTIVHHFEQMLNQNKTWTSWSQNIPCINRVKNPQKRADTYEVNPFLTGQYRILRRVRFGMVLLRKTRCTFSLHSTSSTLFMTFSPSLWSLCFAILRHTTDRHFDSIMVLAFGNSVFPLPPSVESPLRKQGG